MPVDVHAHYVPPQLLENVKSQGGEIGAHLISEGGGWAIGFQYGFTARPFPPNLVQSVDARLSWMREAGIDHQIVGTWPDIFGYGLAPDCCAAWHKLLNEALAEWVSENPKCFSWLCSVPLIDPAASVAELDRCCAAGAVGVIIPANIEGSNLSDHRLDAFWRRLAELALPVLIHPVNVGVSPRTKKFALTQIADYPYDTTTAIGSLIFSGVIDRFPPLKLIWAHGGGAYPYLTGRFDIAHHKIDRAISGDIARDAPSEYSRRMHFDSVVYSPASLRLLIEVAGIGNVNLGTDYSFSIADVAPLKTLEAARLTRAEQQKVSDENPRRLFSRLEH